MTVLRGGIFALNATDLIGFGATLNNDGSLASANGPTIRVSNGAPGPDDNLGSLALRNDGGNVTLYLKTAAGGGNWQAIGGANLTVPEGSIDVANAASDWANQSIVAGLWLSAAFTAGASTTDFLLPARVGGWRLVDAYIRSGGATGGTVQIQTAAGAANVTDAMVPGNIDVITRAGSVISANADFASGAGIRINVAAGAPLGNIYARFEAL